MDWFLYDRDLRHERVKIQLVNLFHTFSLLPWKQKTRNFLMLQGGIERDHKWVNLAFTGFN